MLTFQFQIFQFSFSIAFFYDWIKRIRLLLNENISSFWMVTVRKGHAMTDSRHINFVEKKKKNTENFRF